MRTAGHLVICVALCLACGPFASHADTTGTVAGVAPLTPVALRCQEATDPSGIDVAQPTLSWQLTAPAETRGKHQTAYRILVASSPTNLVADRGDLWDTGKTRSDETLHIPYDGRPLTSFQQVFWKVRSWDETDAPSDWSATATWTMGLLDPRDWGEAKWITDPTLFQYVRHALGYRSRDATSQDTVKWLVLDLGQPWPVDRVRLLAVMHEVNERLGFPRRFKIELADNKDFTEAKVILDQTQSDFRNPWISTIEAKPEPVTARYVRITATKLRDTDGVICLAFSQVEVWSADRNVAVGSTATASDSIENDRWSTASVVDGLGVSGTNPRANGTLLLRRDFTVRPGLRRAVANVCGLGHYELSVNGARAGDALLQPAWSDYRKTCYYDTHDITQLLQPGSNAVGLQLVGGMFNVQHGRYVKFTTPFHPLVAIGHIRLEYDDGSIETVDTDGSWQVAPGPITFSNMYGGEDIDARSIPHGWDRSGFDGAGWRQAAVTQGPGGQLRGSAQGAPPIRFHGILKPVKVTQLRPGVSVYDLGQNVALMIRLKVRGPAGSKVKIIPAELVKADGSVDRRSCGGGKASWNYVLAGEPDGESWNPRFFYHGSRYLEVRRIPADEGGERPEVESLEGVIVHTDSVPAGEFSCSNELFNRIRELIRWAQLSNLNHVLTDCPHRERLGWLEQYHLHGPSLRYEWSLDRLYVKTLQDMADSQTAKGLVPNIAPEYTEFDGGFRDSPEWGSAYVIVPWQHYLWTGDQTPLRTHYEGMKRYAAYLGSRAKDHIVSHGLGDWYDVGPKPPGYAQLTPIPLTATAFYYEDVRILAGIARLLGKEDDAKRFATLADDIRSAFNEKFFDENAGRYATGSQTAQAIPLVMGLFEETRRPDVVKALVADVQQKGLTAGDIGHRYLLRALADAGRSDVVFDLHSQTNKPGYGYILNTGATALTEAWDARRTSSQDHFMLGHITEWFYHDLAGIQPDPTAPGFKRIIIRPSVVGDVRWVRARYDSVRGPIVSRWQQRGNSFALDVEIPPNTTATVSLPTDSAAQVTESNRPITPRDNLEIVGRTNEELIVRVGSGQYSFVVRH